MWQKFRAWPWWGQLAGWIGLPAVVLAVWLWQKPWSLWWRLGLAGAAFLVWVPVVVAAAGGGDSSSKSAQPSSQASGSTQSTTATTSSQVAETTTASIDYVALADEVIAAQSKVLKVGIKNFDRLPRDVRRAYNRLDRLVGDYGTISPDEYGPVQRNLGVLKRAISSGRVHALVVKVRAEARAKARARALARAEAKAKKKAQAAAAAAAATEAQASNCDPNYSGCLNPNSSDYDCAGGSGNGPDYTGTVRVLGSDHYGLDADGDGIGCE
jgi:hypothetical protein